MDDINTDSIKYTWAEGSSTYPLLMKTELNDDI